MKPKRLVPTSFYIIFSFCAIGFLVLITFAYWLLIFASLNQFSITVADDTQNWFIRFWNFSIKNIFLSSDKNYLYIQLGVWALTILLSLFLGHKWYKKIKKSYKKSLEIKAEDKWLINDYQKVKPKKRAKHLKEFEKFYPSTLADNGWVVKSTFKSKSALSLKPKTANKTRLVGEIKTNLIDKGNCLLIGTVGSGKSQKVIIPTLIANSFVEDDKKASFIVTDPKGELKDACACVMKNNGYRVITLNFKDAEDSDQWNPMSLLYNHYQKSLDCKNKLKDLDLQIKDYQAKIDRVLKTINIFNVNYVDFLEGNFFNNKNLQQIKQLSSKQWKDLESKASEITDLINKLKSLDQEYKKLTAIESYNYQQHEIQINLLAENILPQNPNQKDPFWDNAARSFIKSGLKTMLLSNKYNRFSFNVLNLATNLNQSNFENYIQNFNPDQHEGARAVAGFLGKKDAKNSDNNTLHSIKATLSSYINAFINDVGLAYITRNSSYVLKDIDLVPTVIFLVIPDDNSVYNKLIQMYLTQQYQTLVAKIDKSESKKAKRNINFLLEEFGNIGKLPDLPKWVGVGRGRGFKFFFCVQDIQQISFIYGKEMADMITNQCVNWIYLNTKSDETKKKIIANLGTKKEGEISSQSLNDELENVKSASKSFREKPLLSTEQLSNMPNDSILLISDNSLPAFIKTEFAYKVFSNLDDYNKPIIKERSLLVKEEPIYLWGGIDGKALEKSLKELQNFFVKLDEVPGQKVYLGLIKYAYLVCLNALSNLPSDSELKTLFSPYIYYLNNLAIRTLQMFFIEISNDENIDKVELMNQEIQKLNIDEIFLINLYKNQDVQYIQKIEKDTISETSFSIEKNINDTLNWVNEDLINSTEITLSKIQSIKNYEQFKELSFLNLKMMTKLLSR